MVNANTDGGQPEPHRRNAAWGGGRASIRDQAVAGIRQVPKIIETRLLNVLQEFIIARKDLRHRRQCCRRQAFLRGSG